jgi:hypothetical protein
MSSKKAPCKKQPPETRQPKPAVVREPVSSYQLGHFINCFSEEFSELSEGEYKTLMTVLAVCRGDERMASGVKLTPSQRVAHQAHLMYLARHAFIEQLKSEKGGRKLLAHLQRPDNVFARLGAAYEARKTAKATG